MKTTIDTAGTIKLTFDHATGRFSIGAQEFPTEAAARQSDAWPRDDRAVIIDGAEFAVESRRSVEAIAEMSPRLAAAMRAQGWAADLVVGRNQQARELVDGRVILA